MASKAQLHLMTSLLNLPEFKVSGYQCSEGIGVFLEIEKKEGKEACPSCGKKTGKLHQNHWYVVRDLPWGDQPVYLRINRRQMRCDYCGNKFSEEFEAVKKKRTYTERLRKRILEEVLASDIKSVAKRQGVSEQEIEASTTLSFNPERSRRVETMLRELAQELIQEKPQDLRRLGIDEIAVVKGQKNYYKEKLLTGLKKSKYVLLRNEKDLKEEGKRKLEAIREVAPKLGEMHRLKEKFRDFFEESKDWVEGLFNLSDWLKEAQDYFPESCSTIKRWIGEIIAYFDRACSGTCVPNKAARPRSDHRTTQGVVEGINNKIKLIKRRAYGFRNFTNFKIRSILTWHFTTS